MYDIFIKNGFVYYNGRFAKKNIGITGEKFSYVGDDEYTAKKVIDASNKKIIPGLIDPHVHFESPSCDDFYDGSKAASYGGITTVIDFLKPTRNATELKEAFLEKSEKAKRCSVDYHFHACICEPDGNLEEYVLMMKELGINTVKVFTTYSEDHKRTFDKDIKKLLRLSKKYDFLVLAHAENEEMINNDEKFNYKDLAASRPSEAETKEALKLAKYAVQTKGHLYLVHCSSGNTIDQICKKYYSNVGKNIFFESCPRYFVYNKNVLKSKQGYLFTFVPPLRNEPERKLLIKYIDEVHTIGSDHRAFLMQDKEANKELNKIPLGVGEVEYSFHIMYKMFGDKVINKMSTNVAKINYLPNRGQIKVGNFADLCIFSGQNYTIGKPHDNSDYSIFEHIKVGTTIESTMVRGKFVLENGKFVENEGQYIKCGKVK